MNILIHDTVMPSDCTHCFMPCVLGEMVDTSRNERPLNCPIKEVVTCEECKHSKYYKASIMGGCYLCQLIDIVVDDDFYCKYGERRQK